MHFAALSIYGFGHFGKSLLWTSSVLIFAFYLTEVAAMSPATMGWVLALSLVVNAGSDWLIGRVAGHYVKTVRAATALQLAGAVTAGLCFGLFAQTAAVAQEYRLFYALETLVLFRLGYSLYDVPQNAVLALVVGSDTDRAQMSAARYAAAGLANIVVTLCFSFWMIHLDDADQASAFVAFANAFAAISIASAMIVAIYFARWTPLRPNTMAQPLTEPVRATQQLSPVLAFGAIVVFSSLMPVFSKLKVYYAAFAFPADNTAATFLLSAALGQVLAQPLWAWEGRRRSLDKLYGLAALAVVGSGAVFGLAAYGTSAWVLLAVFLFGAASSGLLMAIWAIMGNVAGAHPETALARFGTFTFCSKLAQAASIMIVGQVLTMSAYRDGLFAVVIATMAGSVMLTGCLCLAIVAFTRRFALSG